MWRSILLDIAKLAKAALFVLAVLLILLDVLQRAAAILAVTAGILGAIYKTLRPFWPARARSSTAHHRRFSPRPRGSYAPPGGFGMGGSYDPSDPLPESLAARAAISKKSRAQNRQNPEGPGSKMKAKHSAARATLAAAMYLCQSIHAQNCVINYTVATEDRLKNLSWGLPDKEHKWVQSLQKKYPGVCYLPPADKWRAHAILFISITPDTYHGTQQVMELSTHVSSTDSTQTSTTYSTHEEPYSVDYGIFTLQVDQPQADGKLATLQTFQQKGLFRTLYGVPLGGRGHHPGHAVIEDAVKWLSAGGLTDPNQSAAPIKTTP